MWVMLDVGAVRSGLRMCLFFLMAGASCLVSEMQAERILEAEAEVVVVDGLEQHECDERFVLVLIDSSCKSF